MMRVFTQSMSLFQTITFGSKSQKFSEMNNKDVATWEPIQHQRGTFPGVGTALFVDCWIL
jgi:hypothetical protein